MKKNISRFVEMKAGAVESRGGATTNRSGKPDPPQPSYQAVVGLDVGDRQTHYCVLDLDGEVVAEGAFATRETSLRVQFEGKLECGSRWRQGHTRHGSAVC